MRRHFDDHALSKLQAILDRTFDELSINANSSYARLTRENIASMLLRLPEEDETAFETSRRLSRHVRSFNLSGTM